MKTDQIPKGRCNYCKNEFKKLEIAKHLASCRQTMDVSKTSKAKKTKTFRIMVEGLGMPQYWLLIEAKADAKLEHLDNFLRDIWLECCGHMSEFEIDKIRYGIDPGGELGFKSLNITLDEVLYTGAKFHHRYDFGSTTELVLEVLSEQEGERSGKLVKLLARNNPPEILCQSCGQPATQLCPECLWSDEKGLFCDKCAELHECDLEIFLPVVNSPRVGVCGYTGD